MRYFACGEYGETNGRSHYHVAAIVENKEQIEWHKYWDKGFIKIGELTFQSARYTANYLLKQAGVEYKDKEPPFQLMSKGLGADFIFENGDLVRRGLTRNGNQQITPRFYRKKLEIVVPKIPENEWIWHAQREANNKSKIEHTIRRDKL